MAWDGTRATSAVSNVSTRWMGLHRYGEGGEKARKHWAHIKCTFAHPLTHSLDLSRAKGKCEGVPPMNGCTICIVRSTHSCAEKNFCLKYDAFDFYSSRGKCVVSRVHRWNGCWTKSTLTHAYTAQSTPPPQSPHASIWKHEWVATAYILLKIVNFAIFGKQSIFWWGLKLRSLMRKTKFGWLGGTTELQSVDCGAVSKACADFYFPNRNSTPAPRS